MSHQGADETAGDLPVRDVGLRGGMMAVMQDTTREMRLLRRPQDMKTKDRQRVFTVSRQHLEDQCFRLQEENSLLKQHSRTLELKLRRLSTQLLRLREGRPTTGMGRDRATEDTIQELENRVATLESQKTLLQDKLSLARQHILDMGGRGFSRLPRGGMTGEAEVLQVQRNRLSHLEESRGDIEKLKSSMPEPPPGRLSKLEQTTQSARDPEENMKELTRQQADGHRLTIRENVDFIRLQKQLSDKSAALLLVQEKFNLLQEAYEAQMQEGEKAVQEGQKNLLERVEELTLQLKEERQRGQELETELTAARLSLKSLEELKERVAYLEEERNALKQSYNALVESTLNQSQREALLSKESTVDKDWMQVWKQETQALLDGRSSADIREREQLKYEKEKMKLDITKLEDEKEKDRALGQALRDRNNQLENDVLIHRRQLTAMQERLDSVTHVFGMSVEELSETLLQIKAFRLQQESQGGLRVLYSQDKGTSSDMINLQASYAETVFELQKTRDLLLLQHRISADLQWVSMTDRRFGLSLLQHLVENAEEGFGRNAELKTVKLRAATEKQQFQKRVTEKERMLKSRMRQIITLQAQLRELVYSPKIYKRATPVEHSWAENGQENGSPGVEADHMISQLHRGESLLELHLQGAAFTALGLRVMAKLQASEYGAASDVTTFCTYALLDFETHSTPLVSGVQPSYGFTSRYALTPSDLMRLSKQGGVVIAELHQRLGGVLFVTCGRAEISLLNMMEERGEKLPGTAHITGKDGEILGVLEYWVRLHPPNGGARSAAPERSTGRQQQTRVTQQSLRWKMEIYKRSLKVQHEEEPHDNIQDHETETIESDRSISSSSSDVIIHPPSPTLKRKGDKVRVEILSLSFDPNSRVAMDQSVQRVYVEYRLVGVPMETTETPISLRKPTDGEEVHYNFIRVIHVDTAESASLRHYLYTMLEGVDPNKGRLKFTVVSEPTDEREECVDVGYAYLDLKELLLTGNDITEKPIDILSVNEEEVMGQLKISMEAATALTGIYREYFKREAKHRGRRVKAHT